MHHSACPQLAVGRRYWWRSRFSSLQCNEFKSTMSVVFAFATSIRKNGEPRRLKINFCQRHTRVLWERAPEHVPGRQKEACHRHTPGNRVRRGSFALAAAITPEGDISSLQVH